MTWQEVGNYLQEKDVLILPIGTLEQHGHHTPLGTDTLINKYFCERMSEKFGIPLAPPINYGVHFDVDNDYPGVSTLKKKTLKLILEDLKSTWLSHGFKKIIVMTIHDVPMHTMAIEEMGEPFYLIKPYQADISDILEKQDYIVHACEGETSIMLYLYEKLVKMNLAKNTEDLESFKTYLEEGKRFEIDKYPGNLGYSALATKEKGEEIVKRIESVIADQIRHLI